MNTACPAPLPAWGPYTKRYMGISHVPDEKAGLRFDLSVFPGIYRRELFIPQVRVDTGWMPVEAASDLSYYRIRHGMPDMEKLFCDIDYCVLDKGRVLVRVECVNKTSLPVNKELHMAASVSFPPIAPNMPDAAQISRPVLPDNAIWIDALLGYCTLKEARLDPLSHLPRSGRRRGEFGGHGFTGGQGLGAGVLGKKGDRIGYSVRLERTFTNATLLIRYKLTERGSAILVSKQLEQGRISLESTEEFGIATARLGKLQEGSFDIEFEAVTNSNLAIDGFVICEEKDTEKVHFDTVDWNPIPEIQHEKGEIRLSYPNFPYAYGVAFNESITKIRQFLNSDLEPFMRMRKHDHVNEILEGDGQGHYTNLFIRPLSVPANSVKELFFLAACGTGKALANSLSGFDEKDPAWRKVHAACRRKSVELTSTASGETYRTSQERMAVNVLTNVVYPVKRRSRYIKHYTPGRWWDCLYTWDAGFTALGLSELDTARALSHIRTYLTKPDDPDDVAFVHYGTPVPTQFHAFHSLQQIRPDTGQRKSLFHSFAKYHRFLAGRHGSSTTGRLQSGLLTTWDYFYNSGGWDDYPPQLHVHINKLSGSVAPVSNTAHAIRTARFLRTWAEELGEPASEFDKDIECLGDALQTHAWDSGAGIFSYVLHDSSGEATGFLHHESGTNYNRGLDGFSPLIADICTPGQEDRLISQLFDPKHYWTPIGLSTVDQSAPYFTPDGYWNGAVWMPHQWFLWKALLDHGRADEAHRVAKTALELWKREVEDSGRCFEHFVVQGGRGGGWHQFSGLSCPVLNWFGAYHRPGRLTGGFNLHVESLASTESWDRIEARIRVGGQARHQATVIACLPACDQARASLDKHPLKLLQRYPGTFEVQLPSGNPYGHLVVEQQTWSSPP